MPIAASSIPTSGSGNDRVFASDTAVTPAAAGVPTAAEIAAFATANSHTDTVIYYTGNDVITDPPTYVYHVDASGAVTIILEPSPTSAAMSVQFGTSAGSVNYGVSKVVTSDATAGVLNGPPLASGASGELAEYYNATTSTFTLDLSGSGTVHGSPYLTMKPQSRARFRRSSSGVIVEIIEKPGGLTDVASSAPATVAWRNHTRITSGAPSAIVTLANTTTGVVGDTMEVFNRTAFDLVVAIDGGNTLSGALPTDLRLPPNSGFSARIVQALTVEIVGTGKPIEEVAGTNGHIVIGGTMIQWGRFTSTADADEAFTFATAFSGTPYIVTATISHNLGTTVTGRVLQSSISATGFSFNREDTIGNADNPTVHYVAVGPA